MCIFWLYSTRIVLGIFVLFDWDRFVRLGIVLFDWDVTFFQRHEVAPVSISQVSPAPIHIARSAFHQDLAAVHVPYKCHKAPAKPPPVLSLLQPTVRPSVASDVPSVFTLIIRSLNHAIPFLSSRLWRPRTTVSIRLGRQRCTTAWCGLKHVTPRRNEATG